MFNWRKIKKTYEFESRNFAIELKPGWIEYQEENTDTPLSFIKEKKGVGALQISIATAKNGENFDINETLKKMNIISDVKKTHLRGWTIYEYESSTNEMYSRYFNLVKLNVIVLATYNCHLENINKTELNEAIEIIKSISVISNN